MISKSHFLIFLYLFSFYNAIAQPNNNLDELISEAIALSPQIKQIEAKLKVSESKIDQISNLPDPILTLGLTNMPVNSFSFTKEPMTGKMVSVSQGFPFPGKLSISAKTLGKDIDIVSKEIEEEKNKLRFQIINTYYDLGFIREKIKTTEQIKMLYQTIKEVVKTKYEVNTASQQNIFKIEIELTRFDDELSELKSKEKITLATLNTILFRKSESFISTVYLDTFYVLDNLNVDSLIQMAELNRPALAQIRLLKIKSIDMEEQANYQFYPDFNLMLQYSQRDKISKTDTDLNDFFSVILGIKLPINYGGKYSAKVNEAISLQDMYKQQYQNSLQMLRISLESSKAKLNSLIEREKIIKEGALVQARENFNSALASYQVNEVDFINVTDAINKIMSLENNLYKLRTDYYKEIAGLEFLTGTGLIKKLK